VNIKTVFQLHDEIGTFFFRITNSKRINYWMMPFGPKVGVRE
jgi:hypothetical protein